MVSDKKKINEKNIEAYTDFGGYIKHVARHNLWLPNARALKEEKRTFLKYFTLTGKWAWDIFFFETHGIIEKKGRGFPGVRFCDNNPRYYAEAKKILGDTIGIKENFETLILEDKQEFWDGFPYDIYNLDFCTTLLPNDEPPFSTTFQSIEKIIRKHSEQNYFPFIIFLTMKALATQTNEEAKQDLRQNIETNKNNQIFMDRIVTLIPNTDNFINNNFEDFILISIPKFICHMVKSYCKVEIKARVKYPRHNERDGDYFITKFVFKFTPKPMSTRLQTIDQNYNDSILSILGLSDVMIINDSTITQEIIDSLEQLKNYVASLNE